MAPTPILPWSSSQLLLGPQASHSLALKLVFVLFWLLWHSSDRHIFLRSQMTSDEESVNIKVVALKISRNFYVGRFLIRGHLEGVLS